LKSWEYIIQTKRENIDFINKIVEAYDGLGNVRTLDNKNGLIKIITNSYLLEDMDKVLEKLLNFCYILIGKGLLEKRRS